MWNWIIYARIYCIHVLLCLLIEKNKMKNEKRLEEILKDQKNKNKKISLRW